MSNVFTYPNAAHQYTGYISPEDSTLKGMLDRAINFMDSNQGNPYGDQYNGGTQAFAGLDGHDNFISYGPAPERTPENALALISKFRAYYGVASQYGLLGYPTYESIYRNPAISGYFHNIQFIPTNAYAHTNGTLRIDCRRDSTSHSSTLTIPDFTATDTHGMGDDNIPYSDDYYLTFHFSGFSTSVANEWGNYLNHTVNGDTLFYLKVINHETVEVYTDSDYTTPLNIGPTGLNWSSWTSGGFAYCRNVGGNTFFTNQLLEIKNIDAGNQQFSYYDNDYYSGYGNAVNNEFGAMLVGARSSYWVEPTDSVSSFNSNSPIDHASHSDDSDSGLSPQVTVHCNGDGAPYTGVNGNGCVTHATFNVAFGGIMEKGSSTVYPAPTGAQCLLKIRNRDSDASLSYAFNITNITNASPAVITFSAASPSQSGALKVITGITGVIDNSLSIPSTIDPRDLNGKSVYLKQTSATSAELYNDHGLTDPVDTTGHTAYVSGGHLQDFDNDLFMSNALLYGSNFLGRQITNENPTYKNYSQFAPLALQTDGIPESQYWPDEVTPAKMDLTLIHPTRKSYGQDLTRYTNSTGAYGYRISLTYNNISKSDWKKINTFIQSMRGGGAPFIFRYNNTGGYPMFQTETQTINVWGINSRPRLAMTHYAGETLLHYTGFRPGLEPNSYERQVCQAGDVFFGVHTYRNNATLNNIGIASGDFQTNQFGEAIIRYTAPIKHTMYRLSNDTSPSDDYNYFQTMLSNDEVDYNWHPTGNFVSFKIEMDIV